MAIDPMLAPIVVLVAWTQVMMIWMAFQRGPAMKQAGVEMTPGMRGADVEHLVPAKASWALHNYMHLMEQPTIFYAICFALILMGASGWPINIWLAWGYVVLRIIHSIIQATHNIVKFRSLAFGLSSLCLLALTVHAAMWVVHTARVGV